MLSLLKLYFSRNFKPCRHFWFVMFTSCIFMSCNFMSCNFMSCKLVRHCHVLLFHALHICPSISCPAISCPAILMVRHFHVQHFHRRTAYGPIFLGGLSHLCPKFFSTAPEKTAMLTCKITLPDSPHPVIISKNPEFRALFSLDNMNSGFFV